MFRSEKTRRDFLRLSAAGVGTVSLSGWLKVLAGHTASEGSSPSARKHKSCILLWMDGGPSHKDTFDLKPDSKGAGDFKPISTSALGVQISEHLPQLAKRMHHGVLVRGMSTPEGAHPRAKYNLHTGYREGQGGLVYPSLGAIVSAEIGDPKAAVPNFVSIGNRSFGSGFLGPKHQPLIVTTPSRGVEDLKAAVTDRQFANRLGLLDQMEKAFYHEYRAGAAVDHKTTYERAVGLMKSKEAKAFDLSREPSAAKEKYGSGRFAEGVLMARRLVEVGVPFVEVTLGGWDTHQDNFARVKSLSGQVDAATAALLDDLKDRGLLDSTLVVWMGEFGRTPGINPTGGRDHFPVAWSTVLAGAGVKGGQAVGKTAEDGMTVADHPVSVVDFLATVFSAVGVDPSKENNTPEGRPIVLVKGGTVIKELVG
ncbi:MAG TPA: DUF1501 domain-containing protein [Fimbriiglobus sp.]|nr:DUF1501 domain-containing protein [Fimbriiglobus sp.]